ncbi:MAG: hypothetical protein H7329_15300 [Opitutaceae bacterium]|nr:hypothetical protein [Cytophagales bacterium]
MKTISKLMHFTAVGVIALSIGLTSCKKKAKDEPEPDPDLTTERDLSNSENDMNSVSSDIDRAFDDNTSSNLREEAGSYATIVRKDSVTVKDGITYDKYTTIIYSGSGNDGQTRSGNIEIFHKGQRTTGDLIAYITLANTKVGGRSISVIKKMVQQTSNDPNKWIFNIVANGSISNIDGRSMTYTANKTRARSGINTVNNITDDSFTITGNWSGTNGQGESVSANISSPLQLSYGCHFFREITAGRIDFSNLSKGVTRSIDYGNGGCDGKGTFINTKGKQFTFYFQR